MDASNEVAPPKPEERTLARIVARNAWVLTAFLLVGLGLVAATLLAGRHVDQVDPGCKGTPGIVALEFAGAREPAQRIVDGWSSGSCQAPGDPLSALRRDWFPFIPIYVATLVYWCRYASWFSYRGRARTMASWLLFAAVAAGLLDVLENVFLWRMVDGHGDVTQTDAVAATALAIPKWVLVIAAGCCALGALIGAVFRWFSRVVMGPANLPTFIGALDSAPTPLTPLGDATADERRVRRGQNPDGSPRPGTDGPVIGLAFSGGGIRAASFALGALQRLQREPAGHGAPAGETIYSSAAFLSTVSGGGYTGTATQILNHQRGSAQPPPFAAESPDQRRASPEARYLRENRRFLWGRPLKGKRAQSTRDFVTGAALALAGIAFNVLVVVAVVYVLARPIGWFARDTLFAGQPQNGDTGAPQQVVTPGLVLGAALGALAAIVVFVPNLRRPKAARGAVQAGRLSLTATIAIGVAAIVAVLVVTRSPGWWLLLTPAVFGIAAWILRELHLQHGSKVSVILSWVLVGFVAALVWFWVQQAFDRGTGGDAGAAGLFVIGLVLVAIASFVVFTAAMRLLLDRWRGKLPAGVLVGVGAGAGVLLAALATTAIFTTNSDWYSEHVGTEAGVWLVVASLLLLLYLLVDQKRWSPHLVYKRRLASTFALARDDGGVAACLPYRIPTTLSDWAAKPSGGPKLLICGAAYDRVGVPRLPTKDAGDYVPAWPFVFSDDYVGNADLGWMRTVDFEAALGTSNAPDGTLLAAMAISGAAVSPAIGAIKLGAWNSVISVVNMRLGVWLPNPRYVARLRHDADVGSLWIRLRRISYLLKDIVGSYAPDDRFVYVTDGGQFDNLGVYELLCRRCTEIFCVDASGDNRPGKPLNTNTFDNLRELARRRLGVVFSLPGDEPDGTAGDSGTHTTRGALTGDLRQEVKVEELPEAWHGRPVGRLPISRAVSTELVIHYPEGTKGVLHYIKAALGPDVSADVIAYANSPAGKRFPADTTIDQWLDEDQYDAYVALGWHAAGEACVRRAAHTATP